MNIDANVTEPVETDRGLPMGRAALTVLIVVFLLGAVVRVWAAVVTDFWFDEIWSQEFGQRPVSHIFAARHDNNHLLNTLWCHLVGEQNGWFLYRIPAIVFGSLAVLLAGWIGAARSAASGVFAAVLVAASYLMIHYSSEARGYGPVVALSLLALPCTTRFLERPTWLRASAYWACVGVGLLFHSSFIFAALACGVLTLWRVFETTRSWARVARLVAMLHAVPALFAAALFFFFLQGMMIGGGPKFSPWFVLMELVVSTLGGGRGQATWNWVVLTIALAAIILECVLRWRERDAGRVFYVALLVLTPILTLLILRPEVIYLRYFLVTVPFLLLLFGSLLGRLWQRGRAGRIVAVCVAAIFVAVNYPQNRGLLGAGRGSYLEALRYIEANTEGPNVCVTFPPESGALTGKVLAWYSRFLPADRLLVFDVTRAMRDSLWNVSGGALLSGRNQIRTEGGNEAEWYFVVRWDTGFDVPKTVKNGAGRSFRFVREFPFGSIAGWTWYLYRAQ